MKKYLYYSPRGFANENLYIAYDPKNPQEAAWAQRLLAKAGTGADCREVTRKMAERAMAANRRKGGTYENPAGAKHFTPIRELFDWPNT